MYSGTMIEDLMAAVARAEAHLDGSEELALSQSKWSESGEATHIYEIVALERLLHT